MTWFMRRRRAHGAADRLPAADAEVARLTARADLIVEELDIVVKQMTDMLKKAPGKAT